MKAQVDYRDIAEQDLIDLAKTFCSLEGYGSPTSMRYTLFIKKDRTVGDESFSYQRDNTSLHGVHLGRLREQGLIGLCSVKVYAEGSRYYGIHLSITDERFMPSVTTKNPSLKDEPLSPSAQSYYLPKVMRVMEDKTGNPDYRNVQPMRN